MAHLGGLVLPVKLVGATVVGFLAWRLRGHPRALLWMGAGDGSGRSATSPGTDPPPGAPIEVVGGTTRRPRDEGRPPMSPQTAGSK
jgi:hypothetical protein